MKLNIQEVGKITIGDLDQAKNFTKEEIWALASQYRGNNKEDVIEEEEILMPINAIDGFGIFS